MTNERGGRSLSVIVCGGPASAIGSFIMLAHERGWAVQFIATPATLDFFDQAAIEKQTGNPVKSQYGKPGAAGRRYLTPSWWPQRLTTRSVNGPRASATPMLLACWQRLPASIPQSWCFPSSTALANRDPFRRSVESLRNEGVRILLGPGVFEPHPRRTGGSLIGSYPWHLALDEADRLIGSPRHSALNC